MNHNLGRAMSLAHARHASLRKEELGEHFGGDLFEFLDDVQPYIEHVMAEIINSDQAKGRTEDEISNAVTNRVVAAMFMLGRAFEEAELGDHAEHGDLNHLCTNCGGDPANVKPREGS